MIPIGCGCNGGRRRVQVMDSETAQSIVDQQTAVAPPDMSTIVDPAELVADVR